ncbi:MAG: methylenetetrahydrofolate reductase [Bacteriovoracales bacterium]|nr:methylenetetrahydrofolate reductase [Bacteriovoracales bacterium]
MKIIEHIDRAQGPLFSYEIVPPPRGRTVKDLTNIVKSILPYRPSWIDVTAHGPAAFYHERQDGLTERRVYKKRPGTIGICGIIQNRFQIDTVAHLLCLGFTREETEDALIELNYLGVENVLAIRGDGINYTQKINRESSTNTYAVDLVGQVHGLKQGRYLQELSDPLPLDFCIGVAGYPEKHFEAPNMKTDIFHLKQKVEAGAQYVTTQMFFNNEDYFEFVRLCRNAGITVPIIPGLKVIKKAYQLKSVPKNFHVSIPDELVDEIEASPEHVEEIGIRWARKQTEGLIDFGAPVVHFYIMNDSSSVIEVVKTFL